MTMRFEKYDSQETPHSCPCCSNSTESSRYRYQYDGCESFVYKCLSCSFEFLRPLPLEQIEVRQMDTVDDAELFHSNIFKLLHKNIVITPEISRVKKLLGRSEFSMLDVGCGTGWISKIWADAGATVTGLEPSSPRADIARKRGIRVLSCYVEEMGESDMYDLIVIRHVIEHLEDPKAILSSFVTRLNPGGLLLVVVPNIDCIGRKLFKADWTWVLPWHCNFFNPCSLKQLLEGSGFRVAKFWQTPSPLWYPESFARKFPWLASLLNISPMTMLLFAPLVGLGLLSGYSDNLTIIARPVAESCRQ